MLVVSVVLPIIHRYSAAASLTGPRAGAEFIWLRRNSGVRSQSIWAWLRLARWCLLTGM